MVPTAPSVWTLEEVSGNTPHSPYLASHYIIMALFQYILIILLTLRFVTQKGGNCLYFLTQLNVDDC